MGIYLLWRLPLAQISRLPHAGGDIPGSRRCTRLILAAAPRRWGYTLPHPAYGSYAGGCPTQVGIYLARLSAIISSPGLPHAGGDIPSISSSSSISSRAAPRSVGIYLIVVRRQALAYGLPHTGGDIPGHDLSC